MEIKKLKISSIFILVKPELLMKQQIAILRGINVSGQKKILMADLKNILEEEGFKTVQTYIQSGNVLFYSDEQNLADKINLAIKKHYDFDVPVQVLGVDELEKVILENPFLKEENVEEKTLHVTFLATEPAEELVKSVEGLVLENEFFRIIGQVVYLYCPNGYGKIKMNNTFIERKLKVSATTRNWKTVNKLVELAD